MQLDWYTDLHDGQFFSNAGLTYQEGFELGFKASLFRVGLAVALVATGLASDRRRRILKIEPYSRRPCVWSTSTALPCLPYPPETRQRCPERVGKVEPGCHRRFSSPSVSAPWSAL